MPVYTRTSNMVDAHRLVRYPRGQEDAVIEGLFRFDFTKAEQIEIGEATNIQDFSMVHADPSAEAR